MRRAIAHPDGPPVFLPGQRPVPQPREEVVDPVHGLLETQPQVGREGVREDGLPRPRKIFSAGIAFI